VVPALTVQLRRSPGFPSVRPRGRPDDGPPVSVIVTLG